MVSAVQLSPGPVLHMQAMLGWGYVRLGYYFSHNEAAQAGYLTKCESVCVCVCVC
jgi:hypothetical protein